MSKSKPQKRWEDWEIDLLRQWANERIGSKEIGRRLNRSALSVKGKAHSLKISILHPNIWTPDEENILRHMIVNSATSKMIGDKLGKSHDTVRLHARKLGLKTKRQNEWSDNDIQQLLELHAQGKKHSEIAAILNRKPNAIRDQLRHHSDPLRRIWCHMIARTKKNPHYIKLGITVCERWQEYKNFKEDIERMGIYKPGLSLDRIDSSKGYSPDNVRFATWSEQARNKLPWSKKICKSEYPRIRVLRTTHTMQQIADLYGVGTSTIHAILNNKRKAA